MLLFIGWLYDHSGLLEVARKLTADDRFAGYRLVIAGDGDLLDELIAIAAEPERGDRVVVLGRRPVSEMPELIAACDAGLSVSDPSAAPMRLVVPAKVDEYLELGRPVVATRLPGMLAELGACDAMVWVERADGALEALAAAVADGGDPRRVLRRLGEAGAAYTAGRPSVAGRHGAVPGAPRRPGGPMRAMSNRIPAGSSTLFEIKRARADLSCECRDNLGLGLRDLRDDVWLRSPPDPS